MPYHINKLPVFLAFNSPKTKQNLAPEATRDTLTMTAHLVKSTEHFKLKETKKYPPRSLSNKTQLFVKIK